VTTLGAMSMYIAPSILSADFARLGDEVRAVEEAGADWIHVDVMDGRFVPPITIGAAVVRDLRKVTTLPLDVHLMVHEPDHLLEDFAAAGADWITVHAEAVKHLDRSLQVISSLGIKAGIALNPATPVESVEWAIEKADLVLIMSVNPGYGGQEFIEYTLRKAEALRKLIDRRGLDITLEIDGGVNTKTAAAVASAGIEVAVAGSAVFGSSNYAQAIADIRAAAGHK
jgi:ribulose-phosphate 3-epimerase